MWLGERIGSLGGGAWARAGVGPVTIGGSEAAVLLSGEMRGGGVLAPGGIEWLPERGSDVMLLQTDDGERYVIGLRCAGEGIAPGELRLFSRGAELRLENGGRICVKGSLDIEGDVNINGRLFLNGKELKAMEAGGEDGDQN